MAKGGKPRSPVKPAAHPAEPSAQAESTPLAMSPSYASTPREAGRRRCEQCSRFIPASGPSRCARCTLAEVTSAAAPPGPIATEPPVGAGMVEPERTIRAAPPVPQPRPPEMPVPARSWPPRPGFGRRQVPPPALPPPTVPPPLRPSAPDFVIPRPSQLHPPVKASPTPSGVLLPKVRPVSVSPSPPRRSTVTYVIGILMIAAALIFGVLIPFAGQFVRL